MEDFQNQAKPISGPASRAGILAAIASDPLVLSMFLSMLLIGGDRIALRVGGLTLRVVFPLLMVSFAFLYQRVGRQIAFDRTLTGLFFLLGLAGAASVLASLEPVKSIGYTIWVFFDFFAIISLAYNFARLYPAELSLKLWFLIYRVHAAFLIAELLFNVAVRHTVARPHLWFYETSYLAIFMAGYFGSALFMLLRNGRAYGWEFFLSLVAMLALTSATGLFAMLLAVVLNFIVARQRLVLLLATTVLMALFLGALYLFFRDTIYFRLAGGFLLNSGGIEEMFHLILERSGNRWIRVVVGWQAFLHHPWLGVGIGGDVAYMAASPFPESVSEYLNPLMDVDLGQPFSNILIEVAGTMGLAGLIPLFGILTYAGFSTSKSLKGRELPVAAAFFIAFFSIFLALQFESTFLRYYLWTPLGLGFGVLARTQKSTVAEATPKAAPLAGPAMA